MLPHPLNTKLSRLFLLTGCLKVLLRHTPARSSRFQGQDNFPVTVSTRKVAEQRSIKTALSYNVHLNNILSSDGFSLKWFYEKIFLKYSKMALYPGCVFYLSLLAIKVEKSHCPGEVLNSAADVILTHSTPSIAHEKVEKVIVLGKF